MESKSEAAAAASAVVLPTIEEVRGRREPKRNVNEQHQESLSTLERMAMWTTEHVGTMGFFLIILSWTVLWIGWNFLAPAALKFDPPIAFVFWLFMSNVIELLLMPLIMVGQNLRGRHSEMRAEQEYHTTQQTEHEVEVILRYLETQHHVLKRIEKRLEGLEKGVGRTGG